MDVWLLLLLGLFTYYIVQRSVMGITKTPVWQLWLVMMTPAFIWVMWTISQGSNQKVPLLLVLIPMFLCPMLYWYLLQRGRIASTPTAQSLNTAEPLDEPNAEAKTAKPSFAKLLDTNEEASLQQCFPWNIFYLQNIEYRPQAVICRGQLRTGSETAYSEIHKNIRQHFSDRFLVAFQEGLNGKPFFALVPNPQAKAEPEKQTQPLNRPLLTVLLLLITLLTTTQAGAELLGLKFGADFNGNLKLLQQGLPYAISLMLILGLHELGHYVMTRAYQIQATLPYFLPVPTLLFPLGTLGAFIQIRSPIPHRKALFDVGIAGPIAGLIITIPLFWMGLTFSAVVPSPETMRLFQFEAIDPASSTLFLLLGKLALGSQLVADHAVNLHPIAIAGYLGLLVTALNLMPVGQLDGGHIVHAMFGQRGGMVIGQISRLLFLLMALLIRQELILWAIMLFLLPSIDEPALNNVTELDNNRDFLGLASLVVLLLIILPAPPALVNALL